jgi:hypothetical protein
VRLRNKNAISIFHESETTVNYKPQHQKASYLTENFPRESWPLRVSDKGSRMILLKYWMLCPRGPEQFPT